jgi:CDP-diacylglycerol pyrophosphatase
MIRICNIGGVSLCSRLVASVVGHGIRRGAIGLALNPRRARSQDQLHIHIECLRTDVAHALQTAAPRIRDTWSSVDVGAWAYEAMRVKTA